MFNKETSSNRATVTGTVEAGQFKLSYCQELGLGRIVIIGHSGHGYMPLECAKKYPEYVSHVVMISTAPYLSAASRKEEPALFDNELLRWLSQHPGPWSTELA